MTRSPRSMVPPRPIVRALPALVLMAVAAGCGSIAPPPTTSTSGSASQNPANAAYAYARCMRGHGVSGFPDPQVTTTANGGSIRMAVPSSAGNSPNFKPAQKACRGILPAPSNGGSDDQAHRQVLLAFAHCLRSHGLAGFPDPSHNGQLTLQMITAAGIDVRSNQFVRAGTACVRVTHGAITLAQVRAVASGQH